MRAGCEEQGARRAHIGDMQLTSNAAIHIQVPRTIGNDALIIERATSDSTPGLQ